MAGLGLLSLLSVISLPPSALPLELTDLTGAFMSPEMKGGFERVMDNVNTLDDTVNSCGKRRVCESMSLGQVIERSDGTLEVEKGFLRQAVDSALDAVFEVVRPFLGIFGLGRVARR